MRARFVFMPLLLLTAVANVASAQNITLKIKESPDAGKSITEKYKVSIGDTSTVATGGMVVEDGMNVLGQETLLTIKTLKVKDGKRQQYSLFYRTAEEGKNGKVTKMPFHRKTIRFDLTKDGYKATSDDEGLDRKDLDAFTSKANEAGVGETFLPKHAVKVGGSWVVGKEAIRSMGPPPDMLDIATVKLQATLAKVYMRAGAMWGTIEVTGSFQMKKIGSVPLARPVNVQTKATLDAPIDGSSTESLYVGEMNVRGNSAYIRNGIRFTINLNIEAEFRRERTSESAAK